MTMHFTLPANTSIAVTSIPFRDVAIVHDGRIFEGIQGRLLAVAGTSIGVEIDAPHVATSEAFRKRAMQRAEEAIDVRAALRRSQGGW